MYGEDALYHCETEAETKRSALHVKINRYEQHVESTVTSKSPERPVNEQHHGFKLTALKTWKSFGAAASQPHLL